METSVAVLNDTVLVLNPHEHVVRVEDVFALLTLFVLTEAQGVVTLVIGLTVDGLEDVLGVVLEHLLGLCGQLFRVVLVLLVQFLVGCSAVLGKGRCVHGVTVSCLVSTVHRWTGSNNALVRTTGLKPNAARDGVRNLSLGRGQLDWALWILNELVTLGSHPAVLVVWWNFLIEGRRQLNVSVSSGKGTKRTLN